MATREEKTRDNDLVKQRIRERYKGINEDLEWSKSKKSEYKQCNPIHSPFILQN